MVLRRVRGIATAPSPDLAQRRCVGDVRRGALCCRCSAPGGRDKGHDAARGGGRLPLPVGVLAGL